MNIMCRILKLYDYVMVSYRQRGVTVNVLVNAGLVQMVFVSCTTLLMRKLLYNIFGKLVSVPC